MDRKFRKTQIKRDIQNALCINFKKTLDTATPQELYYAVSIAMKNDIVEKWVDTEINYDFYQMKKLYYFSMEFLPGRLLSNNLMNLGTYDLFAEVLDELKIDLNEIENQEKDPALGNGGLGRLASCFLDSLASLGYPAYGCGIKYKYGLFKQDIQDGRQKELADDWQSDKYPVEIQREDLAQYVKFGGKITEKIDIMTGKFKSIHEGYRLVKAVPCDIPVVGYKNDIVNTLRLWDARPAEEFDIVAFNQYGMGKDISEEHFSADITKVLYPNDHRKEGKELRLRQQYFFVSASLQQIVKEHKAKYGSLENLHEKACFHMNDTHPALVVPELMRILMDEEGFSWEEAWDITTKSCAFTNHTIMAEAMEKWSIDLFEKMLPRIYRIVKEINRRFLLEISPEKEKSMAILYDGQVRMANLAIIAAFSVNGVAKLHTEILKKRELKDFYEYMPEKFNNKTNGMSHRRFLLKANPGLSQWITNKIDNGLWVYELDRIQKLEKWADDTEAQKEFMAIKRENKVALAEYIYNELGIKVDPDSIFDVQIKRFHEYKRQLLNIMRIMHLYNELKENPDMDFYPMTFIFAGKAAASYHKAKLVMNLIHAVADKINQDKTIQGKIKVIFLKNYNVTLAEKIIPGSDVSEQISTASKEASGTGNMKFMLNGAVTIGTLDGANVEIKEAVGEENMFIFGMSAEEVMEHERMRNYIPSHIYLVDDRVRKVMDQLVDGTYKMKNVSAGQPETFVEIWDDLVYNRGREADAFFVLKDFASYICATMKLNQTYKEQEKWAKMAILNVANAGEFSSDRTIKEYVKDIWKLESYFEVE